VIEKFNGENANVTQWMETFKKECARFEIQRDKEKIEIFRLFLEKLCIYWYNSMLIKFTLLNGKTIFVIPMRIKVGHQ